MSGKWGPFFLSSFPLCFFLALLPLCSWDSSSPLFVVSLHSHAPHLVHTMSTSHLHYLVQVGMLLFTNPSRRKVTKVIYWARLLASCDMNWAPRERVESYSWRSRSPLHYRIECPHLKDQECSCLYPRLRSMYRIRLNCMKKGAIKIPMVFEM